MASLYNGEEQQWRYQSLCSVYPSSRPWFGQNPRDIAVAKKVCFSCPVQDPCLEYSLIVREGNGIWGGMTPKERRRYARGIGVTLRH